MTVLTAIAFAAFLLEHDYLFALYKGSEYFTYHFGAFYCRCANLNVTIGISEEYTVKFHCVTFFNGFAEIMNIQELLGFGLELLSLNFYNCVHCFELYVVRLIRQAAFLRAEMRFSEPAQQKCPQNY